MNSETNLQTPDLPTKKPACVRYRFSVPEKDVCVHRWIKNQSNVASSIRELIKDRIKKTGYDDITCYEVQKQGPVGRPRTAVASSETQTAAYAPPVSNPAPQPVVQPQPQTAGTDSNAMLESLMS